MHGGGVARLDGRVDPERGLRRSAKEELSSGSGRTRRLLPTVAPLKLQPGMPGEKALQADEKSLQAERIKLRRGESCKKKGGRD